MKTLLFEYYNFVVIAVLRSNNWYPKFFRGIYSPTILFRTYSHFLLFLSLSEVNYLILCLSLLQLALLLAVALQMSKTSLFIKVLRNVNESKKQLSVQSNNCVPKRESCVLIFSFNIFDKLHITFQCFEPILLGFTFASIFLHRSDLVALYMKLVSFCCFLSYIAGPYDSPLPTFGEII